MKNILKFLKPIITVTICIVLLYSCIDDFKIGNAALDKPQGVELNIDTIYSRKELAERALWSLYHYTPTIYAIYRQQYNAEQYEALSDCIHSVLGWGWINEAWYNGSFSPASNEYQTRFGYNDSHCFEGMRAGYIFLENIDRVPDISDPQKARMKAEAKVIIAGLNWLMFRQFGGIPLVTKAYSPDDEINTTRATIEDMYNHMIQLLDEAIAEPELKWNLPAEEQQEFWGRITKAAAVGQKMLVQLFAASPLFNDDQPYYTDNPNDPAIKEKLVWWGGKKPELWVELKETCEFFLSQNAANGNPFGLVQPQTREEAGFMAGFRDAYWNRGPVRGVNELIYVHLDNYYQGPTWWDPNFHGSSASWGNQAPTAEFMEMFPWANGAPFDTTGLYAYNINPSVAGGAYNVPDKVKNRTWRSIYDGRDPRLYETLWVQKRGQIWKDGQIIQSWPGGNHLTAEGGDAAAEAWSHGICNAKWVMNHNRSLSRERAYSWPILRMGGFHLIYAEALAETGNLSTAAEEVNKVRNRVGLGKIEDFIPAVLTDKEVMIKEILRERACELGYEDTRFTDMCRRKLHFDLSKPLHGVWTLRIDGVADVLAEGASYPDLWYDKRVITKAKQRNWWGTAKGWNPKMYLICIPQNEINKGYGLIQNPGW